MSCFVVNDSVINGILAFSERCENRAEGIYIGIDPIIGFDPEHVHRRALAQRMLDMNLAAYAERYDEPVSVRVFDCEFPAPPSPVHAVKMIDCLLYQCCEGFISRDWDTFRTLADFQDQIVRAIVRHSDEYNAAPWGN